MADNHRQQEVKTRYPAVDGLTAGTTTQEGHQENMLPSEGSLVAQRLKKGMMD